MQFKLYRIKWIDSTSHYGWVNPESCKDYDLTVTGVGYLIKDTDDYVVLSAQIAAESVDAPICIPKIAIISMEEINYGQVNCS